MEKKIVGVLRKYKSFIVTMHTSPDPDALGAALAMTLFLKSIGKKVRLFNEDPCPSWLRFMPRINLYEQYTGKEKFSADAVISLDCGDLERVGKVREVISRNTTIINIDHHVTNVHFGHYNHVQPKYSSTSEILYQILKKARCRFTKDMAILLYLGILTDTGSFGFDCTSSHTHEVIADLLKFNFSVSDLYRQVYETMPKEDLRPFLSIIHRLELHFNERVACLVMDEKDDEIFSGDFDLRDKVFGFLRSVKGLEVIVIITKKEKKRVRINFRSRNGFDVAKLAEKFGGGGHMKASGCFLDGSLSSAKARILREIGKGL
ncbi:MAG: bifunctional oligoribonuclease/PAP phosphatase NrnA [Candidatus Omnitrophica bacterium]|nr:bifunctional oligoribonuclease/PAP phosphatase NrnA [Candidatus Omnitrophota bacterium]